MADAFVVMKDQVLRAVAEMDRSMDGSSKLATTLRGFGIIIERLGEGSRRIRDEAQRAAGGFRAPSFAAIAPDGLGAGDASGHGAATARALRALDAQVKAEADAYDARRKEWEESRRNAAERKRWEEEEIGRQIELLRIASRRAVLSGANIPAPLRAGVINGQFSHRGIPYTPSTDGFSGPVP